MGTRCTIRPTSFAALSLSFYLSLSLSQRICSRSKPKNIIFINYSRLDDVESWPMLNLEIVNHDFALFQSTAWYIDIYIFVYISTMYRTIYCICLLRVKFFVILNKQFAFNLYVGVVVVVVLSIVRVFIVHLFIANWWILKIGLLRAKGGNDRLHLFYHYRFSHHFINYDRCFIFFCCL